MTITLNINGLDVPVRNKNCHTRLKNPTMCHMYIQKIRIEKSWGKTMEKDTACK